MKCLILAAGYATRLYPLTENFPKPLLEVAGRPILDWLIGDLEQDGLINEYLVVTNHKFADIFRSWASRLVSLSNQPRGLSPHPGSITPHPGLDPGSPRITILDDGTSTNETRLGAVKDIQFAIDHLSVPEPVEGPEPVGEPVEGLLVMAGDNLLDFSLNGFLSYVQAKHASCVMRFYEPNEARLRKCGVASLGPDDRLEALTEKPEYPATHWCVPAFYYLTAADVALVREAIDSGCATDAPGSFIAWLCQRTPVYAWEMPGHRYDIGTIGGYEEIKRTYRGISNV